MDNKEKKILRQYFKGPIKKGGFISKSPYIAALIDSRIASGRNKSSGKKLNKSHGSWIGALGYMALVDHVSKVIKLKGYQSKGNSFVDTLFQFTILSEKEIYALYALRCSFAHDYSLYNIPRPNDPKLILKQHFFTVTQGDDGILITFPQKSWNGDFDDTDRTRINLELFGDLVEDINNIIKIKLKKNEIDLVVNIDNIFILQHHV